MSYRHVNYYFQTPIEHSMFLVKNPWDMKEVIQVLKQKYKPYPLTRQVAMHKYDLYDKQGLVLHCEYKYPDRKGRIIENPHKTTLKKNVRLPDDYLIQQMDGQ